MLFYVMLCYVMSCHVMLCYVMLSLFLLTVCGDDSGIMYQPGESFQVPKDGYLLQCKCEKDAMGDAVPACELSFVGKYQPLYCS